MTLVLDALGEQAVRAAPTRVPAMGDVRARAAARRRARRRTRVFGAAIAVTAVAAVAGGLWVSAPDDDTDTVTVVTDGPGTSEDPTASTASTVPGSSTVPAEPEWPRFTVAPGWEVVQVEGTTTASNVPLGPRSRPPQEPWDTIERLEEGDVLLTASSIPVGESTTVDAGFPPAELPLSLDGALHNTVEGQPDDVYAEGVQGQVDGWNIYVRVFYGGGGAEPSAATRTAAQEQLARLEVPPRAVRPVSPPPEDACQPFDLRASVEVDDAAGALQGRIRVRNDGDSPCVLEGLPHIELRDATAPNLDVIPTTTSEAVPAWQQADAEPPDGWPTIRVDPGSEAQAVLTVRNWCRGSDEPPFLFTRLPFHVDRVGGDVPTLSAVPECEDPRRPLELVVGPFEPPRPTR